MCSNPAQSCSHMTSQVTREPMAHPYRCQNCTGFSHIRLIDEGIVCLVWRLLWLPMQAKQTLTQRMSACPEHSEL